MRGFLLWVFLLISAFSFAQDTVYTEVFNCGPYTWPENNQTYNEGGLYQHQENVGTPSEVLHVLRLWINGVSTDTIFPKQDAVINDFEDDRDLEFTPRHDYPLLMIQEWTYQSVPGYEYTLIEFEYPFAPASAQIDTGIINMFVDPDHPFYGDGHNPLSGSNEAEVFHVTEAWVDSVVIFDTRPTIESAPTLFLPASSNSFESYHLDFTEQVREEHTNPSDYHGYLMKIRTEEFYRKLVFASSDNSNTALHPYMLVRYLTNLPSGETYDILETACDSFYWPSTNTTYFANGIYQAQLTDASGCDSLVNLNLTIHPSYQNTSVVNNCSSAAYTWPVNGVTYTQSGYYEASFTDRNGCDSTLGLDLQLIAIGDTLRVTDCDNFYWNESDSTYTSSGLHTHVFQRPNACDSTVYLDLNLGQSFSENQQITACDYYYWDALEDTLRFSGTYDTLLRTQFNCDSLVTLDLTLLYGSFSEVIDTTCQFPYFWAETNSSIFEEGVFTQTYLAQNGCDSTLQLNLTKTKFDNVVTQTSAYLIAPQRNDSSTWLSTTDFGTYVEHENARGDTLFPEENGIYLLAVWNRGCADTLEFKFNGISCANPFFIPNAFTPDGDGKNDIFQLSPARCSVEDFEIFIFDRWGKLMFYSENQNFGWDGKFQNKTLSPGSYAYRIRYRVVDKALRTREDLLGNVFIIR